jgi:AraC family transcriptional regulator of adaptative response/methylated-DNA-[protein]-cysteine methyltransferase
MADKSGVELERFPSPDDTGETTLSRSACDDQASTAYHYRLIARALDRMDQPNAHSLSLDELSADCGLSPAHFQRVFSAWAGISPKRYQQALLMARARPALASGAPLLTIADDLGLSGPSRLHDLTIRWEAMTPGEFAAGGTTEIRYGAFDTPLGRMVGAATTRGLCGLGFVETTDTAARDDLARRWPASRLIEDPTPIQPLIDAAFGQDDCGASPDIQTPEIRLAPIGGPFQIKVWEALLQLRDGETTTYSSLAAQIDAPQAARAVGNAIGANPLAVLIPCHRVLRKSGALGGYHWGLPRKERLLALEFARREVMRGNSPTSHL